MDPVNLLVVIAAAAAFLWFRQRGLIRPRHARDLLRQHAQVIDVRSPAEFAQGHLESAVNIPLSEMGETFAWTYPQKEQPYLLHCLGGKRSMTAKRLLKHQGYTNVHNLGSYTRAARILLSRQKKP